MSDERREQVQEAIHGKRGYRPLKLVGTHTDVGPSVRNVAWLDMKDDAVQIAYAKRGAIHIMFKGEGDRGDQSKWLIMAARHEGDPFEYAAHGSCNLGHTRYGGDNERYADHIVVTNQDWLKTWGVIKGYQIGSDTISDTVSDAGIAQLVVDSAEFEHWVCYMEKREATSIGADIANFV